MSTAQRAAIPLAKPYLDEREEELVLEVLRSGRLSLGPMVRRFEDLTCAVTGARHAAAVSSGTAGLHLAVRAAGIEAGDEVIVLTWLDRARRDVLRVHPRDDVRNPQQGVFNTRSPARPNPIGLHRVRVISIDGLRFAVQDLEALDGTPIVDVKPPLGPQER